MKTIVAGSRNITNKAHVAYAMSQCPWTITEVVSGTARGVDQLGEEVAADLKLPVARFPADWSMGRGAGHARNVKMAHYAEALVAIWDGHSTGTKHMIETATRRGLKVFVVNLENLPELKHSVTRPSTRPRFT
jgi:hypothetical protein